MAKKNYYAVKKGKTPGIYRTWEECKSQTSGVTGAEFKGFATLAEAEAYIRGEQLAEARPDGQMTVKEMEKPTVPATEGEAVAYVDGSYNVETGEYSCGVVFLYQGEELHLCRKGEDEELAEMRNVAGEIFGAGLAMAEAVRRGAGKLTIYHDYQGIASWCLGEWKTNKEGTRAYKAYYDSLKDTIDISFQKVKGHSGDAYNELADKLAKSVIF